MAALNDRNFGFFFLFCFFVLEFLRNELLSTADYFVGHKEYLMILFLLFSIFTSSLCDRYDAQVIIKIKDVFRKLKLEYWNHTTLSCYQLTYLLLNCDINARSLQIHPHVHRQFDTMNLKFVPESVRQYFLKRLQKILLFTSWQPRKVWYGVNTG